MCLYLMLSRYNGRQTGPPRAFSPLLEEALQHVEKAVRREMAKRKQFPLEWAGGEWSANVCAANCYRGSKEGVGAHSDQLTCGFLKTNITSVYINVLLSDLGPYPTIASVSLGVHNNVQASDHFLTDAHICRRNYTCISIT